jgi:hypothetical protein
MEKNHGENLNQIAYLFLNLSTWLSNLTKETKINLLLELNNDLKTRINFSIYP